MGLTWLCHDLRAMGCACACVCAYTCTHPDCELRQRAQRAMGGIINIRQDLYCHDDGAACFCNECKRSENEYKLYRRGKATAVAGAPTGRHPRPAANMYCPPRGWYRFGLLLPPRAEELEVMQDWHVAFHATSVSLVGDILKNGRIAMAGETVLGGETLAVKDGHIKHTFRRRRADGKTEVFDPKQVYLSRSMRYCACKTTHGYPYAKPHLYVVCMCQVWGAPVRVMQCAHAHQWHACTPVARMHPGARALLATFVWCLCYCSPGPACLRFGVLYHPHRTHNTHPTHTHTHAPSSMDTAPPAVPSLMQNRGASSASCGFMLWSTMRLITCTWPCGCMKPPCGMHVVRRGAGWRGGTEGSNHPR